MLIIKLINVGQNEALFEPYVFSQSKLNNFYLFF